MGEEQKEEEKKEEAPEPPEIVLKVDMHCEGCARKVQKSLRQFEGVEEVKADSRAKTVVVKGKAADPAKICERVQRKTGRRVELISPLPPPPEEEKKEEPPKEEAPPPEEKKEEPKPITVVLKIRMHCETCAQILQKRIKKMEGVESVETDTANDQILVKGTFDPNVLVENVYKRTGRQVLIVPEEEKKEEENKEEVKKDDEPKEEELKKYEYRHPFHHVEYAYPAYPAYPAYHAYHAYQPPDIQYGSYPPHHAQYGLYAQPQVFSDENPNACSVM
ncbi:heavy metal-associated isoprenylated plant protein 26-like protein [Carex littledalei]|uniref:Heavy metal-associated isoprenylated plant protein 26-like protein n=1 Tax=Carex littledalei TaxID=544730 RepID=A0A833Q6F2_9POAL|nr:heavy metal-associated isoprenylated plant protein 26-like protein [Carex littledalei]